MSTELYQVREETKQNTKDIAALTRTVDRLAVMYESTEKTREEDRDLLKKLAVTMQSLDKQVGEALHIAEQVLQLKEDFRIMKHDLTSVVSAQTAFTPKFDDLLKDNARQGADIVELKKWHDRERDKQLKEDGGEELKRKAWKNLTMVGSACAFVAGGVVYVLNWMLK